MTMICNPEVITEALAAAYDADAEVFKLNKLYESLCVNEYLKDFTTDEAFKDHFDLHYGFTEAGDVVATYIGLTIWSLWMHFDFHVLMTIKGIEFLRSLSKGESHE